MESFNSELPSWDVSKVTSMESLFYPRPIKEWKKDFRKNITESHERLDRHEHISDMIKTFSKYSLELLKMYSRDNLFIKYYIDWIENRDLNIEQAIIDSDEVALMVCIFLGYNHCGPSLILDSLDASAKQITSLLLRYLYKHNVGYCDQDEVPFKIVAALDFKDVRTFLEDNKIYLGATTDEGFTLLHFAATNLDPSVAAYLIEKELDVNALSNSGQTPLTFGLRFGKNLETHRLLLKSGAELQLSKEMIVTLEFKERMRELEL